MVTILNFILYGLPKVSPSHLYKEETFHPYKYKLYFGELPKFPKKKKSFVMGQSNWLIAKRKGKKTNNELGMYFIN